MIAHQTLDVRTLPPRERHERIFATLAELPIGAELQIVNDHDPKPLGYQLQAEHPGEFDWNYLEQGPERWRVAIARVAQQHAAPATADPAAIAVAPAERRPGPHLDNRGLEPPEPMVRILEALNTLEPHAELTVDMDREPLLLYPHLAQRGFAHAIAEQADGCYLLRIWRDA